jgi:probable phosphoglycerate mutase
MELLLIRHALPVRVELVVGPADPELSEAGRAQTVHLADYLAAERLDAVYASPLRRAIQTGEPVAARHGCDVVVVDDVAEWDRVSPEYIPVEELKAADDPRWRALIEGVWTSDESPAQFRARVLTAIEQLVDSHAGGRIAVVCHGGVINTYLAAVLGLDPARPGFFYPNYTSIHRVMAASTGQRSVLTINETSHLRGTGLPIGLHQTG